MCCRWIRRALSRILARCCVWFSDMLNFVNDRSTSQTQRATLSHDHRSGRGEAHIRLVAESTAAALVMRHDKQHACASREAERVRRRTSLQHGSAIARHVCPESSSNTCRRRHAPPCGCSATTHASRDASCCTIGLCNHGEPLTMGYASAHVVSWRRCSGTIGFADGTCMWRTHNSVRLLTGLICFSRRNTAKKRKMCPHARQGSPQCAAPS